MTTGSFTRDTRQIGPGGYLFGDRKWRSWSGTDRVVVETLRVPPTYHETIYNGRKMRFRDYSVDTRPPQRAQDEYHPYSVQESVSHDIVTRTQYGYTSVSGSLGSWTAPNVSLLGVNDDLKLINGLWEQVKGSQFNAAVTLGEGREVLGMIGGNAIRLAKSLHHLRRGDISKASRSLLEGTNRKPIKAPTRTIKDTSIDNLSSYWLELQYGWLPLLGDVKAGAEFLAHQLNVPLQTTYHTSVFRRAKSTLVESYGVTRSREDVHTKRIRAVISENPSMVTKLGLMDPALVAWELVPYSFVVDWFLPIGDWLEARASVSSLKGVFYRSESKRRAEAYLTLGSNPNRPYTPNVSVAGGMAWSTSFSSNRWKETTLKVPLPEFKPLSKALSVKHCLNAIALLANFR